MKYIVFDLEWNQGNAKKDEPPGSLSFEIIEIGAVKLDENFNRLDSFHRIIKPVVHTTLFKHTKDIISLTEKELSDGVSFETACKEFLKWCRKGDRNYSFATWGPVDLYELQRNMAYFNIYNGFSRPLYYYNIQYLFNIFTKEYDGSPYSLEDAVKQLQLDEDKTFHSAISDAIYASEILRKISDELDFLYPSVDTYKFPLNKKQEVEIDYPDHKLNITRAYKSKEAIKKAYDELPLYCHICGKKAKRILPWYTSNSKNYYMVGKCRTHGFIKGKRLIKSPDNSHFFAVSTLRAISNEQAKTIVTNHKSKKLPSQKKNRSTT